MTRQKTIAPLPIAVVIPAYNRADMLSRALASVRAQQPSPPEEVIVVDDGSDDDTAKVAAELGARVIRHPKNLGLAAARNSGLNGTLCEWVAFLDSDDEWLPHHLAHLWEIRDGHALVAGSALRSTLKPAADRVHGPLTRRALVLRSGSQLVDPENIIPVSATMVKRDILVARGGFQDNWGVEDLDLWLRILEHDTGICSPVVTIIYYVHGEQMSAQSQRMRREQRQAIQAHSERTHASNMLLQRLDAADAWFRLREALADNRRGDALHQGLYIASRPSRLKVVLKIFSVRFRGWRRAVAASKMGIGPKR